MTTQAKTLFPPYSQMVMNLFKPMDGVGSKMMHAAIGMAGESAELRTATGRKNLLEECGDIEFYMEAAWLQLPSPVRDKTRPKQARHTWSSISQSLTRAAPVKRTWQPDFH